MNVYFHSFKKVLIALLLAILCLGLGLGPSVNMSAEAKKKAGGPDPAAAADAEVKKVVDPINIQLTKLMVKVQSRALLSPADAGQLTDIKYKLEDALTQYPQNALLAKPLYQSGILFCQREGFNDAYELFSYLAQGYPTTPYGLKAKGQMAQLEKRFGADYFATDAAVPVGDAAAPAATTTPPPKK